MNEAAARWNILLCPYTETFLVDDVRVSTANVKEAFMGCLTSLLQGRTLLMHKGEENRLTFPFHDVQMCAFVSMAITIKVLLNARKKKRK